MRPCVQKRRNVLGRHSPDRDYGNRDRGDNVSQEGKPPTFAVRVRRRGEHVAGNAPVGAGSLCIARFGGTVHARSDPDTGRNCPGVGNAERAGSQLRAARSHRERDIDPVIDHEPAVRLRLECGELHRDIVEKSRRECRGAQVEGPAIAQRAHVARCGKKKIGMADGDRIGHGVN